MCGLGSLMTATRPGHAFDSPFRNDIRTNRSKMGGGIGGGARSCVFLKTSPLAALYDEVSPSCIPNVITLIFDDFKRTFISE